MMNLCERRCQILKAIIDDYVETAEPIGSETLARRYNFGIKPATIRNELAAMSELGYLRQPHTSAGRIPSDLGYRFYVDTLMPVTSLGDDESKRAKRSYDPFEGEVEYILQRTCRILTGLTQYTSLATTPQLDTIALKQVALLSVGNNRIMAVIIINNGRIDHRAINYNSSIELEDLLAMTNFINKRFEGVDYNELLHKSTLPLPFEIAGMKALYESVINALKQSLCNNDNGQLFIEGASNILRQPEFMHSEQIALIMEALENRRNLFQILGKSLLGRDVSVVIGSENSIAEMQECSFVVSAYSIGERVCGSIAVIGPTRMNYERAVSAVQFMASNLSSLLTSLSLG